jgi:hypothetical protein
VVLILDTNAPSTVADGEASAMELVAAAAVCAYRMPK